MSLKELWEVRGITPTQLAGQAGISVTTLYKMNRKEPVARRTILAVCKVLLISEQEYQALDNEEDNQ